MRVIFRRRRNVIFFAFREKFQVTCHILPIGQNISPDNVGYHREAISHFHVSGNISLLSALKLTAYPFVPPLATPSMIFLRKIKNSTISGTEMTTTAAIIAGMFSRPKPFSRIS